MHSWTAWSCPTSRDSIDRTYDVWSYNLGFPSGISSIIRIWLTILLSGLRTRSCGSSFEPRDVHGRTITDQALAESIRAHNENRRAMRELYELRKEDAPRISGAEMMKVLMAATSVPVDESTALIKSVTEEAKNGRPHPAAASRESCSWAIRLTTWRSSTPSREPRLFWSWMTFRREARCTGETSIIPLILYGRHGTRY